MLLIGSMAAKIRQCLPTWRAGVIHDLDFVGTMEEYEALVAHLETKTDVFARQRANGMCVIIRELDRKRLPVIEFDPRRTEAHLLMEAATDLSRGTVLDREVSIISERTQLLIKKAYADIPVHREKNDQDIAFWESRLGSLDLEDDLLYQHFRTEMLDKFSHLLEAPQG